MEAMREITMKSTIITLLVANPNNNAVGAYSRRSFVCISLFISFMIAEYGTDEIVSPPCFMSIDS